MIRLEYLLDDKVINPPLNHEETSIELNFDTDDIDFKGQVSTNKWEFGLGDSFDSKDAVSIINKYNEGGLNSYLGVSENIRFKIKIFDDGVSYDLFDGGLDVFNAEYTCHSITAESLERNGIDWLNKRADSFTFEYLFDGIPNFEAGSISRNDFVNIPYILSDKPEEAFTLILSTFVVTRELIQSFKEFQEFSVAFTSDYLEFGNLVTLIFILVQNILLLLALIVLLRQISELLVKSTKYTAGMFARTLCQRGAEYLGLTFESSILIGTEFNNMVIIPESYKQYREPSSRWGDVLKDTIGARIGVFDVNQTDRLGFFRGTYGDLLRELKKMFNAKLILDGDVLRLEREDYFVSTNLYKLPNLDLKDVPFRYNYNDFNSVYSLSFTPDLNDKNVWQDYIGTEVKVVTSPRSYRDTGLINGGSYADNVINLSLGRRKEELSWLDKFFITMLANSIDKLLKKIETKINRQIKIANATNPIGRLIKKLNAIGIKLQAPTGTYIPLFKVPSFAAKFGRVVLGKIGFLIMEDDYIHLPKVVLLNTSVNPANSKLAKVSDDNSKYINAKYLYEKFHSSRSFVNKNGKHNQYKVYSVDNVPFCIKDYLKVRNNSLILYSDGVTKANIISLKWNIFKQTASITFKINELYTNNYREEIIESDGR